MNTNSVSLIKRLAIALLLVAVSQSTVFSRTNAEIEKDENKQTRAEEKRKRAEKRAEEKRKHSRHKRHKVNDDREKEGKYIWERTDAQIRDDENQQ